MSSKLLLLAALLGATMLVHVAEACCEGIVPKCPCDLGKCPFKDYVKCGTCCKDHTACCKNVGVTGLCLELCNGTKDISYNDPMKYADCAPKRDAIQKCNRS